jgi:hypothetical protein
MPNTTLTHKMIAREAAAILEEEAPFIMNINRGRESDFKTQVDGYKKGDFVDIKIPPRGRVFDGSVFAAGGAATDSIEQSVRLQLNTQKHIGLQFGAKEKLLEVTEFRNRILRPQMQTLASVVEADLLIRGKNSTPNLVGTPGTVPTQMIVYAQARQKLQENLAPEGDRSTIFSSAANTQIVDSSRQLFHARQEVERGFLRGRLGEAQGAMFYEHQSTPVHVNGTQASWTINGAGQTGSLLSIGGLTAANTITAGTVFTIANVFAVHPQTGVAYTSLQQFVVTADFTAAAATGAISVYPPITPAAPNRTVSAGPAGAAACTMVGAVSTSLRRNLMFQSEAYTTAFAPLPVLASCEGYTATLPSGVSVRVMTFGDGNNDYERTRIDVLYGFAAPYGIHACGITE